jgi:peptide/nickel transport system ATP-binding protein
VTPAGDAPLLSVRGLEKHFEVRDRLVSRLRHRERLAVHAVDGVDLDVFAGETLGVVGESGCGKSTLGRLMVRLEQPTRGTILYDGHDLVALSERALRPYRRALQIVFQDPSSTLNPRQRVGSALAEALRVHRMCTPGERDQRVRELLALVELPEALGDRYPANLSGGQRQRVGIARALAVEPALIVADEPVSALDVSVQAQILNVINDLKQRLGVSWVFIGHNLATVRQVSDRIAVMYLGRVVEQGSAAVVLSAPLHPYTRALLESVPQPDPTVALVDPKLTGDPPSPIHLPPGCRFAGRCPLARPLCAREDPMLSPAAPRHDVACWAVTQPGRWSGVEDSSAPVAAEPSA